MVNGRKPVLTGLIQTSEPDPTKRKVLGRIALWALEPKKDEDEEEESLFN